MPGVHVETLTEPTKYSLSQIALACRIAAALGRGKLILCEPPDIDES